MSQQNIIDVFSAVVRARRSVRGFLAREVDQETLNQIFELAQTAPSNCNTQPWCVHVVSGAVCSTVKKGLFEAASKADFAMDFPYSGKYDNEYKVRQYDAANQLYTAMGIPREDKVKRGEAFMRNYQFFDAPHAVFLFLPETFGIREAADLGMYAQNLMLTLTAFGLASCPQTALSMQADFVRKELGVPENLKLLFGISFGFEDQSVLANNARVGREPIEKAVVFHK